MKTYTFTEEGLRGLVKDICEGLDNIVSSPSQASVAGTHVSNTVAAMKGVYSIEGQTEMVERVLSFASAECFGNYEAHPKNEEDRTYGEYRRSEITELSNWNSKVEKWGK